MTAYPPGYYAPRPRPIGVTILAILTILIGVLILIGGIFIAVGTLILFGFGVPPFLGLAAGIVGLIVILFGLLWIGVGVGLLNLRSWAWWLAVIVMVLSLVSSLANAALALVPLIILVYLILVREHFH